MDNPMDKSTEQQLYGWLRSRGLSKYFYTKTGAIACCWIPVAGAAYGHSKHAQNMGQ